MFKVNNRKTRTRCEICSKLTIKIPERRQYYTPCSSVSIVNFELNLVKIGVSLLCCPPNLVTIILELRKDCPYLELFWSVFYRIRTGYGEIRSMCPCSFRMRENADQNNPEYGHFFAQWKSKGFIKFAWSCNNDIISARSSLS